MVLLIVQIFAMALVLFGVIASISPIPFGFLFIAIGLAMMLATDPRLRATVHEFRLRRPGFDRKLRKVEDALPHWLAAALKQTRPAPARHDRTDEAKKD